VGCSAGAVCRLSCFFFSGASRLESLPSLFPSLNVSFSSAHAQEGVLNVVMGCNDGLLSEEHTICTAASCTTNCLAPVVKVSRPGTVQSSQVKSVNEGSVCGLLAGLGYLGRTTRTTTGSCYGTSILVRVKRQVVWVFDEISTKKGTACGHCDRNNRCRDMHDTKRGFSEDKTRSNVSQT